MGQVKGFGSAAEGNLEKASKGETWVWELEKIIRMKGGRGRER